MDRQQTYSNSSADVWKAAASVSLAIAFLIIPVSTQVWITAVSGAQADGELFAYVAIGALMCYGLTRRVARTVMPKAMFLIGLIASIWTTGYAYRGHQDMLVLKHAVDAFSNVFHDGAPTRGRTDPPLYVPGYQNEARTVADVIYQMADITYDGLTKMKAISEHTAVLAKQLDMKPEDIFFNPSIVDSNRSATAQIDSAVGTQVNMFNDMMKNMQSAMAGANVPAAMKKGFDESYATTATQMFDALKNLTAQELALTTALNSYMDFAQQETGKVKMQNGKLLFPNRAELDEFNLKRAAIQSTAKSELAAVTTVKQIADNNKSSFAEIKTGRRIISNLLVKTVSVQFNRWACNPADAV